MASCVRRYDLNQLVVVEGYTIDFPQLSLVYTM